MSFASCVATFTDRFLSDRTARLIVEPALADLYYAGGDSRFRRLVNRLAVVRAVAGGLRDDVQGGLGSFAALLLVPAGYYLFFLLLGIDFFSDSTDVVIIATSILFLSLGPVMVCFWPERRVPRAD